MLCILRLTEMEQYPESNISDEPYWNLFKRSIISVKCYGEMIVGIKGEKGSKNIS